MDRDGSGDGDVSDITAAPSSRVIVEILLDAETAETLVEIATMTGESVPVAAERAIRLLCSDYRDWLVVTGPRTVSPRWVAPEGRA